VLALSLAAGNALADKDKDESGKGRKEEHREDKRAKDREKELERAEKQREKQLERAEREREKREARDDKYFQRNGYDRLSIPKGHYPPPGRCRAWYPDRPAGHQPPPQDCNAAVPAGAWLIQHPSDRPGRVRVTAYQWSGHAPPPPPPPPPVVTTYRVERPRAVFVPPPVVAVGEFDISNGMFIRVIVQR
jgi:hypothetical protein